MKNMLTKEIVPTYSMPTVSINSNVSGIKEVGISVNPIISVTFNKNDGGTITLVEIYRGNELINSKPFFIISLELGIKYLSSICSFKKSNVFINL